MEFANMAAGFVGTEEARKALAALGMVRPPCDATPIPAGAPKPPRAAGVDVLTTWTDVVTACEALPAALDKTHHKGEPAAPPAADRLESVKWAWRVHGRAIFVKVAQGKLQAFLPFANPGYRPPHAWPNHVLFRVPQKHSADEARPLLPTAVDRDMYYTYKADYGVRDAPNLPPDAWWNNGGTVCNWIARDKPIWGQAYLSHLAHMVGAVAGAIGDAEFILNKRDAPLLPTNPGLSPVFYLHADARRLAAEGRHPWTAAGAGGTLTCRLPVLSPYSGPGFKDALIPTVDDWEAATSLAFPPGFGTGRSKAEREAAFLPWAARKPVAFFRGSATGAGTTPATNPRLALALAVRDSPALAAVTDVGITAFSGRDRVHSGFVSFIHPGMAAALGQTKVNFVPQAEQAAFKYVIYAPGHSAASRMGCCLLSGSVTLFMRADPETVAPWTWLSPKVEPRLATVTPDGGYAYAGEAPPVGLWIEADASNLQASIDWCIDNDGDAEAMAAEAKALGESMINLDAIREHFKSIFA